MRWLRRFRRGKVWSAADPTVSIVGFSGTASGIGLAARSFGEALAARSPRLVSISELAHTPRVPTATPDGRVQRPRTEWNADIALHVYNPDVFLAAVRRFGVRFLTAPGVNVAVPIWETETPPPAWKDILSVYDVVWTPSRFSARALEKATGRPVAVVPISLPEKPPRTRRRSDGHYVLLVMFDRHSCLDRKNPQAAIRAFRLALRSLRCARSARLVVKCHADTPADVLDLLRREAGDAPVEFRAATLDEAGMEALWQECDCLLSLHRSEGFGLPVAEALSRAIPVITSRQGGVLDFADETSCRFVPGGPAVAPSRDGQYAEWSGWLEPDLEVAASHIVDVLTHYDEAVARAARGRLAVQAALSPQRVRDALETVIRGTVRAGSGERAG